MIYEPTIHLEKSDIYTQAILGEFRKNYKKLDISSNTDGSIDFIVGRLTQTQVKDIQSDLTFFKMNPYLPKENVCCHFWNYKPKNESQSELLEWANRLLKIDDPTVTAGLFVYGDAGVGKSHISTAVAKELIKKGQEAYFISAEKIKGGSYAGKIQLMTGEFVDLGPDQVWVIDDLVSGYGPATRDVRKIVINAHERGGRVFITSNTSYEIILDQMFTGEEEAKPRYEDRTRGMFKILEITGESARTGSAWYQRVSTTDVNVLKEQLRRAVNTEDYEEAARLRDLINSLEGNDKK